MDSDRPNPQSIAAGRRRQIQAAQDMQQDIYATAERYNLPVPQFEFLELVGKGSFGNVYKCKQTGNPDLVAVKVLDLDSTDYKADVRERDHSMADLLKEVQILRQLKDAKAKNINRLLDAFDWHHQLWIISVYSAGGSVSILMKASPSGLAESYIIPIAREIAIALKYVHEAGIIHRDVKCANILILEDGQPQLCDFGVSGMLDNGAGKRTTIIGTPHWMPPEMHASVPSGYGMEVDCWAFGCTVYEMATGKPPNKDVRADMLGAFMTKAPRLEGGDYPDALREFVAFCLEEKPEDRPSAEGILKHPYVANTSRRYPVTTLRRLLEDFAQWEYTGGQRNSLFMPGFGADAPELLGSRFDEEDNWNFSTTDEFRKSLHLSAVDFSGIKTPGEPESDSEPQSATEKKLTPFEKAMHEQRVKKGGDAMERLFNLDAAPYDPYEYVNEDDDAPLSDLPLRNISSDRARNRTTMIDLDAAMNLDEVPGLDLADLETLKASRTTNRILESLEAAAEAEDFMYHDDYNTRRATQEWKFPSSAVQHADNPNRRTQDWSFPTMEPAAPVATNNPVNHDTTLVTPELRRPSLNPAFRPTLQHTATDPIGTSLLDFNFADPSEIIRPSTAGSAGGSTFTDTTSGDPFDLENQLNDLQSEPEAHVQSDPQRQSEAQRTSFHRQSSSEPVHMAQYDRGHGHARGSSLSSDGSEAEQLPDDTPGAAEAYWEATINRLASQRRVEPLLRVPPGAFQGGNFARYDPDTNPAPELEPALPIPDIDDPDFPLARLNGVLRSSASRARGANPVLVRNGTRPEIDFPEPLPPDPAALAEGADPDVVAAELVRLLGEFGTGLGIAADLLRGSSPPQQAAYEDEESGVESGMTSRAEDGYMSASSFGGGEQRE
ncbi:kinase-like domain-containing protein [Cryomyces antarcticus]